MSRKGLLITTADLGWEGISIEEDLYVYAAPFQRTFSESGEFNERSPAYSHEFLPPACRLDGRQQFVALQDRGALCGGLSGDLCSGLGRGPIAAPDESDRQSDGQHDRNVSEIARPDQPPLALPLAFFARPFRSSVFFANQTPVFVRCTHPITS